MGNEAGKSILLSMEYSKLDTISIRYDSIKYLL